MFKECRDNEDREQGDHMQFLQRLIANPRNVGALAPSGSALGAAMAAAMDAERSGPVLELGPGSGAITKALLASGLAPERLTVIEQDPAFAELLTDRYPDIAVLCDDAFNLPRVVGNRFSEPFSAIVSSLPLLNFPFEQRRALLKDSLALLAPGAPFIQFTYGLKKPLDGFNMAIVRHQAFVWKNLPPAHVWVYRTHSPADR